MSVLSVRFEVGVSLLLAPARADKKGPKVPFPLVENAGIQPVIRKRVPAGAPAGAGSSESTECIKKIQSLDRCTHSPRHLVKWESCCLRNLVP